MSHDWCSIESYSRFPLFIYMIFYIQLRTYTKYTYAHAYSRGAPQSTARWRRQSSIKFIHDAIKLIYDDTQKFIKNRLQRHLSDNFFFSLDPSIRSHEYARMYIKHTRHDREEQQKNKYYFVALKKMGMKSQTNGHMRWH